MNLVITQACSKAMSGRPMNHQRTWASFWLFLNEVVMDHDLAILCGENLKFATGTFRFGRGGILQNSVGEFEKSSHGIQNSGGKIQKISGSGIQNSGAGHSKNLCGGIQSSRGEFKSPWRNSAPWQNSGGIQKIFAAEFQNSGGEFKKSPRRNSK